MGNEVKGLRSGGTLLSGQHEPLKRETPSGETRIVGDFPRERDWAESLRGSWSLAEKKAQEQRKQLELESLRAQLSAAKEAREAQEREESIFYRRLIWSLVGFILFVFALALTIPR